jgi:hypothetical protein
MKKEHFCLLFLVTIIFLSGCTQQTTCSNDVITIVDYNLYSRTLYSGGRTGIDFRIVNSGDSEIKNVEVDFFDTSGLEISDLKCGGGTSTNNKCVFQNMQQDVRDVSLRLSAPEVKEKTPYTVSFSVSYSDSGGRTMVIPIIDGVIKREPTLQYSVSPPSCDPIQVDIEKEVKPEETQKEYWTMVDMPFEVKFIFNHVGTVEEVKKIKLEEGDVILELNNLKIQEPCDFDSSLMSKKAVDVNGDENDNILTCNFIPIILDQPEYTGLIDIKYRYNYEFVKSETFTIYPSG